MDSIRNIVDRLRESRISEYKESYKDMDHDDLIRMSQEGDQKAFEELLLQYDNLIEKQVKKYFLDNGTAGREDIKQIASIAFWDAVKTYDPSVHKHGFGAFANLIMNRKLADLIRGEDADRRKLNNLATSMDEPVAGDGEGGTATLGDTIPSNLSADEEAIGNLRFRELVKFMEDNLSETERDVIRKYIEGYKVSEIAEVLGMKYKSTENALMRVKNKVAEYMRRKESQQESKKLREDSIEFTDEEKRVLTAALDKIDEKNSVEGLKLREAYDNYTEEQLDSELGSIEKRIEEIINELERTPYQAIYQGRPSDESNPVRDELIDELGDIRTKISAMEEYLTDEQYERSQNLFYNSLKAENTDYDPSYDDIDD